MDMDKNAFDDLLEYLEPREEIEAVVFGPYGWNGYCEEGKFVPDKKKGVVLTADEAAPFMKGWSFDGDFGAPSCYAVYVWTNKRVIWVTQYDGATWLSSAPRNPTACMPEMPGGGG